MAVKRASYLRTRKIKLPTPGKTSQRARETIAHLEKGWLPVQEELLAGIHANLKNGHYNETPDALLHDIQKDPGLFFTLCRRLRIFSDPNVSGFDPIDVLSSLEDEQLAQTFDFEPGEVSKHRSWDSSPSQELIHSVSRVSAETATTLAGELDFSSNTAHEGALFRQLGYQLIAWNYPKLFSQALSAHRTRGADLEKELKGYFDITPQQIGARFARELEMAREIKQTLIPSPERYIDPGKDLKEAMRLTDVCQLSELFAKASEPEHFPHAEDEWAAKESVLRPVLGDEVIEKIEHTAEEVQEEKAEATDFGDLHDHVTQVDERAALEIPPTNRHLGQCDEELQKAFLGIYRELERSQSALEAIRLLIQRAIPETGVVRGCLYLQRKKDFNLQAALRFGESSLPNYQKFLLDGRNGIVESLHSQAPFTKEGAGVAGSNVIQVRGGMGPDGPAGVLYLEIDEKTVREADYNPLLMFHIIRGTLHDCLKGLEDGDKSKMSFY